MDNWLFWAICGTISVGIIAIMLQAMRRADVGPQGQEPAALRVYRDQLAEVDRDLARNVISAQEAERLRTEVSRRLLEADRAQKAASGTSQRGAASAWVAGGVVVAAVAGGLVLYERLGAPGYPDFPLDARLAMSEDAYRTRPSQQDAEAQAPVPAPNKVDPQFADLMTKLRDAVKARPDDVQGLTLLAKNEAQLGDFIASRKAYEQLVKVKAEAATAQDHLGLAQTMIIAAGGFVSPEAEVHLNETLKREPTNGLARYFTGLLMAQVGRFDHAFEIWEPLLREGPADASWMPPINAGLQEVADRAGIKFQMPAAVPALRGPSGADVAAAADMSGEDRQAMIASMVAGLEERLYSEGGSLEEWLRLMSSLSVLGETARAKTAYERAVVAYGDDVDALGQIESAASEAEITP